MDRYTKEVEKFAKLYGLNPTKIATLTAVELARNRGIAGLALSGMIPHTIPGSCLEPDRRIIHATYLLDGPDKLYPVEVAFFTETGLFMFDPKRTCYTLNDGHRWPVPISGEAIMEMIKKFRPDKLDEEDLGKRARELIRVYRTMDDEEIYKRVAVNVGHIFLYHLESEGR